ncbi:uncharacterized protein LOC136074634 [Hydra vulgaris]|uniref:Uncharacterized protein LOC136074634 n=1 Tax=Hydra vulgaris TaxID=6087 RepID=A0ABM4B2L8_HYDVU
MFKYSKLKDKPKQFKYLCGLTVLQFELLYNCVAPYCHLIEYPDCKGTGTRFLEKKTELFSVLTLCRHALHLGVIGFMAGVSKSTIYRVFTGWVVFLDTIFSEINLKVESTYIFLMMPSVFKKTGHGETDIVVDATEFKFQQPTNYDLNTLMFSSYKNCTTGKALIGISPHGSGLLFGDIYPGSVTDNELTEQSHILELVEKEHEVMADRGFSIQDLCASKGIYLNRPSQKSSHQFPQADVAGNFDIASTRIHVERFIGCVRDWSILNAVWPVQRMDLLSSTWKMLCHVVNLTMRPIGPKPESCN